jgi:uncharacterized membrane protein (DUF485 family)
MCSVRFSGRRRSDANLTVAMTAVFLVMSLFWAVRYNGVFGFAKHVFGVKVKTNKWVFPVISLLFLFIGVMEAVSIFFARPVALAMRLYGNVFAGETMLDMGIAYQIVAGVCGHHDRGLFLRNICLRRAGICVCAAGRGVCGHDVLASEEEPGH